MTLTTFFPLTALPVEGVCRNFFIVSVLHCVCFYFCFSTCSAEVFLPLLLISVISSLIFYTFAAIKFSCITPFSLHPLHPLYLSSTSPTILFFVIVCLRTFVLLFFSYSVLLSIPLSPLLPCCLSSALQIY